ncbi:MAG: T9SS type A sorting domain-containing protein, partial [Candidatus Hatepunaea meridiana]|nr:T9SS type A sorting domain-containing protein [Candidatus Hatepunaea meridiana]
GEDVQMLMYPVMLVEEEQRDEPDEPDVPTHESWQLTLQVSSANASDLTTVFGVDTLATDDFDARFDYPEPPLPPAGRYLTACFRHDDWDRANGRLFNHDIRSEINWGATSEWVLTVATNDTGQVTLSWQDIDSNIPEYHSLILEDLSTDQRVNMLETTEYCYNNDGIREFRIYAEANGINGRDPALIPSEFFLAEAYPNPFNAVTHIPYGLPVNTSVSIKVYDITGRQVAMLIDSEQLAGRYTLVWDSQAAPTGMYIVRMEALGFMKARKVMLVK